MCVCGIHSLIFRLCVIQIWRGETVLVSKLVADQRTTLRKGAHNKPSHVMDNVSGFTPHSGVDAAVEGSNASNHDKENNNSRRRMEEPPVTLISQEEEEDDDDEYENDRDEDDDDDDESSIDEVDEEAFHRKWSSRGRLPEKGLSGRGSESEGRAASSTVSSQIRRRKGHSSRRRSLVSEDRPPSRSLLVPMLELQELLTSINSRVTSGLIVSRPDWEDLRELATRVGGKFTENDIFQWENQEREPNGNGNADGGEVL